MLTFKEVNRPLVIAHRGYKAKYPENTLLAFQAALDAGVQMIELDVTLSKDRELIVIHDDTLERTTDGYGPVDYYTLKELKALDAGGWFHPKFAGERIPTLEDVLVWAAKRVVINIEIKSNAYEAHQPADSVERQIIEMLCRYDAKSKVLISSFESKILENFRTLDKKLALGVLSDKNISYVPLPECKRLNAYSWHPHYSQVSRKKVAMMHTANIRVFPYTVNTPDIFWQIVHMGVDGIFSDDPQLLDEIITR